MTVTSRLRMTASELAVGRYLRAPDHTAADTAPPPPPAPEPAPEPAPAPEPVPVVDEFAAAFDSLAVEPVPEPAPAATDVPPAPEPAPAPAPEPAPAAADVPAPEPALSDESGEDILKKLVKVARETPVETPPPPAAEAPPASEPPPLYNDEELKLIEEHDKEWGDMSRVESLKRRAEYRGLMSHVFKEVSTVLEPIREMVESMATRTHLADIKGKIGEYTDQDVADVAAWSKTQPKYLQDAFLGVIESGTADEVSDLVSRYRKETGKEPAPAPASTRVPTGGEAELSDEAKKAAASLAPVDSKRSVIQSSEDPSDFDGSFERWKAAENI